MRTQTAIAAAVNIFIGGMIAFLIYHKADFVPMDTYSIAVDLLITCLLTFVITTLFSRASLRRYKTGDVLPVKAPLTPAGPALPIALCCCPSPSAYACS